MKVTAFFKNRYVLYITVILGVTNLLGYIGMENYDAMALLVVMFLLARYFSKNIAINICIAIFVTSIVTLNGKLHEGFKEGKGRMRAQTAGSSRSSSKAGKDKTLFGHQRGLSSAGTTKSIPKPTANPNRRPVDKTRPQYGERTIKDPVKPEDPKEPPKDPEEPPKEPPKEEPPKEEPECPKGTELVKGECVPSVPEKKKTSWI